MKSVKVLFIALLCSLSASAQFTQPMGYKDYSFWGQVNIGNQGARLTAPSAYLELGRPAGSLRGLLLPRGNKDSVENPVKGLLFYDLTLNQVVQYNGSQWVAASAPLLGFGNKWANSAITADTAVLASRVWTTNLINAMVAGAMGGQFLRISDTAVMLMPYALKANYYTRQQLQTSGQAQVHWDNLVDVPPLGGGNGGAVASVFGRTGVVTAQEADYSSYYPRLSQVYNDPAWISKLAFSKLEGVPDFALRQELKDTAAAIRAAMPTGPGGTINIDPSPSAGSPNAVSSGGVYAALNAKADTGTVELNVQWPVKMVNSNTIGLSAPYFDSLNYVKQVRINGNTVNPVNGVADLGNITGGTTYTFNNSSIINTSGNLALSGDAASPGNNKVYGTNASGVKGYQSMAVMNLTSPTTGHSLFYSSGAWINRFIGISDVQGLQTALDSRVTSIKMNGSVYNPVSGQVDLGNVSGGSSGSGTVTSVGVSVPTGLVATGSPVTTSGTITIGLQSGYSIPTTAKQANWDAAYGWGNHAGLYRPISYVPAWAEVQNKPDFAVMNLTSPVTGQSLFYSSGAWVNRFIGISDVQGLQTALDSRVTSIKMNGSVYNPVSGQVDLGNVSGGSSGSGTVTSVGVSVPTGLVATGSPVTTSGTITIGLQSGYSIPTTAKQTNWDAAYGWGNHAGLYRPVSYVPAWAEVQNKPDFAVMNLTSPVTGQSLFYSSGAWVNRAIGIADVSGLQAAIDGKENSFTKNTAFNKNFGTAAGTVAQGNDSRILNGQTAYTWGNHAGLYLPNNATINVNGTTYNLNTNPTITVSGGSGGDGNNYHTGITAAGGTIALSSSNGAPAISATASGNWNINAATVSTITGTNLEGVFNSNGFLRRTGANTFSSGLLAAADIPTLPASKITQDASNRFVTDAEKAAWNGKQGALGFTPESIANKVTDFTTINNTYFPTVQAVESRIDSKIAGLGTGEANTVVAPDANMTITATNSVIILPEPTAQRTITLPAASTLPNKKITIVGEMANIGKWILMGSYVQKGTGAPFPVNFVNSTLSPGKVLTLVSDGTKWYEINPLITGTGGSSDVTGVNVGTGIVSIYKQKSGNNLEFRKLTTMDDTGVGFSQGGDDVYAYNTAYWKVGSVQMTTSSITGTMTAKTFYPNPGSAGIVTIKASGIGNSGAVSIHHKMEVAYRVNSSGQVIIDGNWNPLPIENGITHPAKITVTGSAGGLVISVQGDNATTISWNITYEVTKTSNPT